MKLFVKVAPDFSRNISGCCIPKNSLYGYNGKFYWYLDNYIQFEIPMDEKPKIKVPETELDKICKKPVPEKTSRKIVVWIMGSQDKCFKKTYWERTGKFAKFLSNEIFLRGLSGKTCIYPNRAGVSYVKTNFRYEEVIVNGQRERKLVHDRIDKRSFGGVNEKLPQTDFQKGGRNTSHTITDSSIGDWCGKMDLHDRRSWR